MEKVTDTPPLDLDLWEADAKERLGFLKFVRKMMPNFPLFKQDEQILNLISELRKSENELEYTRVQLSACSAAICSSGEIPKVGDYGYSASYQDVLNLKQQYKQQSERLASAEEALKISAQNNIGFLAIPNEVSNAARTHFEKYEEKK